MLKIISILTKIIVVFLISILFSSCKFDLDLGDGEKGNGNSSTEVRKIDKSFTSIDVDSRIEVILEQASEQFVSVEAESNLQEFIETKVYKGVLYISPSEDIKATKPIKVIVKMSKIETLEASSSSEIKGIGTFKGENISVDASSSAEIDINLKYDNVTLDASSASVIKAEGIALKLESSASSAAQIEAEKLLVNVVNANVSSAGSIKIHPILSLVANASSGGNINYAKNPKSIAIDESSGGNVSAE